MVGILEGDDWARVSEERSPESFKLSDGIQVFADLNKAAAVRNCLGKKKYRMFSLNGNFFLCRHKQSIIG